MIEFNGYISGVAEKHFWRRERVFARKLLLIGFAFCIPWILFYGVEANEWLLIALCAAGIAVIWILTLIPKREKEKKKLTPKKITLDEDGYITCKTDTVAEARSISDVQKVKDYGEFYDVIFRMGKVSNRFICQKSLLTIGTLGEFEALFGEKLERVEK